MLILREEFSRLLEAVRPGVSSVQGEDQSNCVIFSSGTMFTYDDMVACSVKSPFDFECAVRAEPLIKLVGKLKQKELDVSYSKEDGGLLVKAKGKRGCVRGEDEIKLKAEDLEAPDDWSKLGKGFGKAVDLVSECVGVDESVFLLTCVHITPGYVEACDNYQACRYRIKTDIGASVLLRGKSLKLAMGLGACEISVTDNWVHFRSAPGQTLSTRRYLESYPDLDQILEETGHEMSFPTNIDDILSRCVVFSTENLGGNHVAVRLKHNLIEIRGDGDYGWYAERKVVDYDDKPLGFLIPPSILARAAGQSVCKMSESKLAVTEGRFHYVTSITKEQDGTV